MQWVLTKQELVTQTDTLHLREQSIVSPWSRMEVDRREPDWFFLLGEQLVTVAERNGIDDRDWKKTRISVTNRRCNEADSIRYVCVCTMRKRGTGYFLFFSSLLCHRRMCEKKRSRREKKDAESGRRDDDDGADDGEDEEEEEWMRRKSVSTTLCAVYAWETMIFLRVCLSPLVFFSHSPRLAPCMSSC